MNASISLLFQKVKFETEIFCDCYGFTQPLFLSHGINGILKHDCNNNFETIIFFRIPKSIKIHICRLRAMHTKLPSSIHSRAPIINIRIHYARLSRFVVAWLYFVCVCVLFFYRFSFGRVTIGIKKLLDFHSSFGMQILSGFCNVFYFLFYQKVYSCAFFYRSVSENGS